MGNLVMTGAAARRLGISATSVRDMVRDGRLPTAGTTDEGYRLYRHADVERVAEQRQRKADDRKRRGGAS